MQFDDINPEQLQETDFEQDWEHGEINDWILATNEKKN
jgi:hypothetical protein